MFLYDEKFYSNMENISMKMANIMMPYVINWIKPKSVVDFGCGEGIWLSAIKSVDANIEIFGLDGDYISKSRLRIPEECFLPVNLEREIELDRKYDLAISLEVAEHIAEKYSDIFVDSLIKSSDNILFSAAIPGQGGTNHINEQWQSYWIEKFKKRGYFVDISIREFFWNEERISPWRRQNILFFSKSRGEVTERNEIYDIVHPKMYERLLQKIK